mgnify:CR=1 FL=1
MNYKAMARDKAGWFVNELWRKTGHEYRIRTYTLGEHHLVIHDATRSADVIFFSGNRWKDVFASIRDAWNAFCEVRDA